MRKGFTLIELLIVLFILAILSVVLLPAVTLAREKAISDAVKKAVQINEVIYVDERTATVQAINGGALTVRHTNGALQEVRWLALPEIERKRLEVENRQENDEDTSLESPSRSQPSTDFIFHEGDIVRHKLNGWRGVIVSVTNNTATVRFQVGNEFQTVEGVRAHEVRAGY